MALTKKLTNHIMEIITENPKYAYQYTDGERWWAIDDHRILEYGEELPEIGGYNVAINAHAENITRSCEFYMKFDENPEYNYRLFELPTAKEIREGIHALVGRKQDRVLWCDDNDTIVINARYLLKAMEALNAKVGYIAGTNPYKMPILLYQNDDLQANIKELILPVLCTHPHNTGCFEP